MEGVGIVVIITLWHELASMHGMHGKRKTDLLLLLSGKTFLRYLNTGLTLLTRYQPFWLPLSLHKHNCNHGQR